MSPSAWHWVSLLGIGVSLLIGIGLMSLLGFYRRHGYDDLNRPDRD
jgi:hypothetical protein